MLRPLLRTFTVLIIFAAVLITFCGCGEGGGTVVSSLPAGNGYKVMLSATPDEIVSGGSVTLIATIFDPQGNPIADEDNAVLFSSDAPEASFSVSQPVDVKGGSCQTAMQWEDRSDSDDPAASANATITASYRGAIAVVKILVIAKSF